MLQSYALTTWPCPLTLERSHVHGGCGGVVYRCFVGMCHSGNFNVLELTRVSDSLPMVLLFLLYIFNSEVSIKTTNLNTYYIPLTHKYKYSLET